MPLDNTISFLRDKIKPPGLFPRAFNFLLSHSSLLRFIKRSLFPLEEVSIRQMTPRDEKEYLEFIRSIIPSGNRAEEDRALAPNYAEGHSYYLARYRHKIVGGAGINRIASKDKRIWRITGVTVLPEFCSSGIGEKLLSGIILDINEKADIIFLGVNRDNRRAIRLYKKLGFSAIKEGAGAIPEEIGRQHQGTLLLWLQNRP